MPKFRNLRRIRGCEFIKFAEIGIALGPWGGNMLREIDPFFRGSRKTQSLEGNLGQKLKIK